MSHALDIVEYEAKKAKEKAVKDKNVGVPFEEWNKDDQIELLAIKAGVI